tara:strand:+ start:3396 stop:3608 length:213 start_codon:yes stop_codon:yes gene_type:complete
MTITNEIKIWLAYEIMDRGIASCYPDGTIKCFSWEQANEVSCWLEKHNLDCKYEEFNVGGEFWIRVTITG